MKKILTIIGARPQFIKSAMLSRAFDEMNACDEVLLHTGQHYDYKMSQLFFDEMGLKTPHHELSIGSLPVEQMIGRMIEGITNVTKSESPDLILVYGDTNSTLAGALTASFVNIPLAHVEAGLRSYNLKMPEERNRVITDQLSSLLFCPTKQAVDNLLKESANLSAATIHQTGDVMLDCALHYGKKSVQLPDSLKEIASQDFILFTLHRAENTDDSERLKTIVFAMNEIHKSTMVVWPMHPRTVKALENIKVNAKVKVIDPLGYLEMLDLIKRSSLVMTDSGGLQKEAFFFQKPCITLRNVTEWNELVDCGANLLAGNDIADLPGMVAKMKGSKIGFENSFYGDGNAAMKIAEIIEHL